MTIADTLGALARTLVDAVRPLADALATPAAFEQLLRDLGRMGTVEAAALDGFPVAVDLGGLLTRADALIDTIDRATDQGTDAATDQGTDAGAAAAAEIVGVAADLLALVDELRHVDGADLDASLDDAELWVFLADTLPGHLLASALEADAPVLYALARFTGLIDDLPVADGSSREVLALDRLAGLVGDPVSSVRARYGWGTPSGFDQRLLIDELATATGALGLPVETAPARPRFVDQLLGASAAPDVRELVVPVVRGPAGDAYVESGVVLLGVPQHPGGAISDVYITDAAVGAASAGRDLGDGWEATARADASGTGALGVRLAPGATTVEPGSARASASWAVSGTPDQPWSFLGGLVHLDGVSVSVTLDTTGDTADLDLTVALTGLAIDLPVGDTDAFVRTVMGGQATHVVLGTSLSWSTSAGLRLGGAPGLDLVLPVSLSVGPVAVTQLHVGLAADGPAVVVVADADVGATLGVLALTVQGLGVRLTAAPADGTGSLGPLDVAVAVAAPTGLGIGIDIGEVRGGGFLAIDAEAGTYEGVIDVGVLGVDLSAVVIVDASAADDWSMFFALFLGLPSIQLGFGFALTGVGGLAGINRTLDPEALGAAVRSGALGDALFPDDPIAQAPSIIDTFGSMFPAADGQVVFGPVVRIGWGTPTLVEAVLGIVVALPDPILVAVVGSVTSILPTPEVDLVALHLDVGGVIDPQAGTLSLSASLHDSHVVGFALSGDLELRAEFGDPPSFLMALGGFHPDFEAPPGFPAMERLRLALSAAPLFDVSFECYLALTSNTVQFGAAIDLSAEIEGFQIAGGASFDALVRFNPFALSTDLGFYITVRAVGIDLAGVWLDVSVAGPNNWVIDGVARFEVLGFEQHIDVHEVIGPRRTEQSPPAVDPRQQIVDALSATGAWSVVASPAGAGVVVAGSASGELQATPESTLAVAQQVAPLGVELTRIGNAPIGEYTSFGIESVNDGVAVGEPTTDWFAPAGFFDLGAADALDAPSFERLSSGVLLGRGDALFGAATGSTLEYEQIVRDPAMGVESLTLGDDPYRPFDDLRPAAQTAFSVAPIGYRATVDDGISLVARSYSLVDVDTAQTSERGDSWTALRAQAGTRTAIAPSWEVSS